MLRFFLLQKNEVKIASVIFFCAKLLDHDDELLLYFYAILYIYL